MEKYVCTICGYIYDEAEGVPEDGIAPGTSWEDVADGWVCILCGADKDQFEKESAPAETAPKQSASVVDTPANTEDMSPRELSILCANLARGCTKQYKAEEAALFNELADYFKAASAPAKDPAFEQLAKLVEEDFDSNFVKAKEAANDAGDRGALRALVWSDKVTRIIKSILSRYEKQGEAVIEDKDVSVCTVCGFIFVGNQLPELCPVCKVPNNQFEKIEGR